MVVVVRRFDSLTTMSDIATFRQLRSLGVSNQSFTKELYLDCEYDHRGFPIGLVVNPGKANVGRRNVLLV
jgi:hypothetical protein